MFYRCKNIKQQLYFYLFMQQTSLSLLSVTLHLLCSGWSQQTELSYQHQSQYAFRCNRINNDWQTWAESSVNVLLSLSRTSLQRSYFSHLYMKNEHKKKILEIYHYSYIFILVFFSKSIYPLVLYILLISLTVKNKTVLLIYTREKKKNEKWTGAFNDPKYYKRFLLAHVNYIKP